MGRGGSCGREGGGGYLKAVHAAESSLVLPLSCQVPSFNHSTVAGVWSRDFCGEWLHPPGVLLFP